MGCCGWSCIDVMEDVKGNFWLVEVNICLGMISYSIFLKLVVIVGYSFECLVECVLELSV